MFKFWLEDTARQDFMAGNSLALHFFEATDAEMVAQGYRKIKTQYDDLTRGIRKGDLIWWKKGEPTIPVGKTVSVPSVTRPAVPESRPAIKPSSGSRGPSAQRSWTLAEVIGPNERGLHSHTRIALAKRADGNWDFVSLESKQKGWLPAQEIQNVVKSIRDVSGKPIQAANPKELVKNELIPNPYLDKIVEDFKNTNDNIIISALAGTGKTTALKKLASLKKPDERWLYLVFGKKNEEEASKGAKAFPPGIEARTSHSFLGKVLNDSAKVGAVPDTSLWSEKRSKKLSSLMQHGEWIRELGNSYNVPPKLMFPFKSRIKRLAEVSKAYALNPNDKDINEHLKTLIKKYSIDTTLNAGRQQPVHTGGKDFVDAIIEGALTLLGFSLPNKGPEPQHNSTRDHDDTLWWAALHADDLLWPHYDVVLVDEAQDLNKAQQIMIKELEKKGARIIIVGDTNQSIFFFRGSDSEAFENLNKAFLPQGGKSHDLLLNFRNGTDIIDYSNQNTKVKNLQAGRKHKGLVTDHQKFDEAMEQIDNEWNKHGQLNMETVFLSRTNRPLVHVALDLMKQNIPFVIIGREFAEELTRFIEEICGVSFERGKKQQNVYEIQQFWDMMLRIVQNKERDAGDNLDKKHEAEEMKGLSEALGSVLSYLKDNGWQDKQMGATIKDTKDFISYLKSRFGGLNVQDDSKDKDAYEKLMDNPQGFVTLCTAHRSKGLEFDRVYLVRGDQIPHPASSRGSQEERDQEENLRYVLYTRPIHEFHVLSDKKP